MSADVQSSPKVVDHGGRVQSGPKAAAGMPHHRRTSGRIQQQRRAATASTGSGLGQKDKKPANFHHHHNNNNSRKRSQSFSGGGGGGATVGGVAKGGGVANAQGVGGGGGGKMFPAYKRRKKDHIVPPTKFLLGGNICDPLNLNSLLDEDINRAMNAVTPKSSPLPTPKHRKGEVEVIIPPNINDPLNLLQMSADGEEDCDYEKSLISPVKGGAGPGLGKKNKRKRRHTKSFSQDAGGVAVASAASDSRLQEPDKPEAGAGGSAVYTSAMEAASLTRHSALGQSDLQPVPTFSLPSPLAERVETDKTKKITPIGVSVGDSATTQSTVTTPTNTSSTLASSAAVTGSTTNSPTTTKSAVTSVSGVGGAETVVSQGGGAKPVTSSGGGIFKKCRKDSKDKIVSPAIPQPGAWGDKGHHHHHHRFRPHQLTPHIDKNQKTPNFKEVNTRFRYGNYNRYYGYRNPSNTHNNHNHQQQQQHVDPRLKVLLRRRDLFEDRDVLDIGCNVGHVTLAVARDTNPKSIVGIDIDRQLVDAAKRNVKHYVKSGAGLATGVAGGSDSCGVGGRLMAYPRAMPAIYGPLDAPPDKGHSRFPYNVSFVQGNYVLDSDALLSLDSTRCQFDTILCLSVTKWFHLNWGDGGLKRAFRRMYAQLRPGGKLILEPQPWHSYKKKRNLTPEIWENYKSIELFPHKFSQFLLSDVGFTKCELVGTPHHHSKGFQRPIKLFTKGELNSAPSSVRLTGVTSPEADVVISLGGNSAAKTSVGEGNSTVTSLKDDVVMSEGNNVTKTLSGGSNSTVTSLKDDEVISSERNDVTEILSGEGNSTVLSKNKNQGV